MSLPETNGYPVLCDLGEAKLGIATYDDPTPEAYRAPEVTLDIPWTFSVDIWNFALMAWAMIEGNLLSNGDNENGEYSPAQHMVEMVGVLGLPPKSFLMRGEAVEVCFHGEGAWSSESGIPHKTLEEHETQFEGDEKVGFLTFIRKMLCCVPDDWQTAQQLLQDPWLNSWGGMKRYESGPQACALCFHGKGRQ